MTKHICVELQTPEKLAAEEAQHLDFKLGSQMKSQKMKPIVVPEKQVKRKKLRPEEIVINRKDNLSYGEILRKAKSSRYDATLRPK